MQSGALQLSLFDERDMASITAPDFPGERLVVCRNPDLAAERRRKRDDLLAATERDLARIQAAVTRRSLGARRVRITVAVGHSCRSRRPRPAAFHGAPLSCRASDKPATLDQ